MRSALLLCILLILGMLPTLMGAESTSDRLRANPLRTHADVQQAIRDLHEPLVSHYGPGGIHLGHSQATYGKRTAAIEAFLRPWWGLAPLQAGGGDFAHWDLIRSTLVNSTDPTRQEFWGYLQGPDQRTVEMAALSLGLLIAPEQTWKPLTEQQRKNLAAWLQTVRTCNGMKNNWIFFRILCLCALRSVGEPIDEAMLAKDLDAIDSQYLGEGWYSDGPTSQRDYYIPMAMHFYGLIYATLCEKQDPERAKRFRERAALFAADFQHWFTPVGDALPYGRSLTYRFAQSAFWSAIAYANVEVPGLTRGQIKGLWLRNLRWWFQQPIFTDGNVLSVGYAYPNQLMAEFYNAPGSPYWSMKSFLAVALPSNHPFWQTAEEPLPARPAISIQPHPGMILCHDDANAHTVALTGGQFATWLHPAGNKYEKFAYSTHFGFCASGASGTLNAGFDSTLALSDDGQRFRSREACEAVAVIAPATLYSRWKPWADVEIETWLTPTTQGHVRIHHIRNQRALTVVESGFALDRDWPTKKTRNGDSAWIENQTGISAIRALNGPWKARTVSVDPNLNLLHALVETPSLSAELPIGEHWLGSVVVGSPLSDTAANDAKAGLAAPSWSATAPVGVDLGTARLVTAQTPAVSGPLK